MNSSYDLGGHVFAVLLRLRRTRSNAIQSRAVSAALPEGLNHRCTATRNGTRPTCHVHGPGRLHERSTQLYSSPPSTIHDYRHDPHRRATNSTDVGQLSTDQAKLPQPSLCPAGQQGRLGPGERVGLGGQYYFLHLLFIKLGSLRDYLRIGRHA